MAITDLLPFLLPAALDKLSKAVVGNVVGPEADGKTVVECRQVRVVGNLIGGADEKEQRNIFRTAAIIEDSFIENRQKSVKNGAVSLENLIEKGDFSGRQQPLDDSLVTATRLKGFDINWSEELVRFGKAGQKVFKIGNRLLIIIFSGRTEMGKAFDEFRFSGSRRSRQKHMLLGDGPDDQHLNNFILGDEGVFQKAYNIVKIRDRIK